MIARAAFLLFASAASLHAQNIVDEPHNRRVAKPIRIDDAGLARLLAVPPVRARSVPVSADAQRISAKLAAHVEELLSGWPWMPFHHTLGISGYELSFAHPDELFHSLAVALPHLPEQLAERTRAFLHARLAEAPPYEPAGFQGRDGRARESYEVPVELRIAGRSRAQTPFGVYAFWLYCARSGDAAAPAQHWPAIKQRMHPLLRAAEKYDPDAGGDRPDRNASLNGAIAGLIGYARLAALVNEPDEEQHALARLRDLIEVRINLDRTGRNVIEPSGTSTKKLHHHRLARYERLVPELAAALREHTDRLAAERLHAVRHAFPGWHVAFGDRFIGGENYTTSPHFSLALFTGAALVERVPAEQLRAWIDVPWCRADLAFIEKCAWALE